MSQDNKQPELAEGLLRNGCNIGLPVNILDCQPDNIHRNVTRIFVVNPDASPEIIAELQKVSGTVILVEGTPECDRFMATAPQGKPIKITNPYSLVPKVRPEYNNRAHKRAKLKPKGKKKYGW